MFANLCAHPTDKEVKQVTVAVVGNAPSLLDQPRGRYIDEHDVIVRFNSPVLTGRYNEYSGRRTNVWVLSPTLARQAPMRGVRTMIVSGINILAGESGYWQCLAKHGMQMQVAVFREEIWYSLVATLHAPPTAGLLMLTSLKERKSLRVSAYGFSGSCNTPDDHDDTCHRPHSVANHYADRQPASTRHNWNDEAKLMAEWFKPDE